MDINITFQDARWNTDPNPAIVAVGTKVRWIIRAPKSQLPTLRWIIEFGKLSPFAEQHQLVVETRNTSLRRADDGRLRELARLFEDLNITEEIVLDHRGVTQPIAVDNSGEYKYDLRVENTETDEVIGEEDPILLVLRGPFKVWH
jgi:hypothetical protein